MTTATKNPTVEVEAPVGIPVDQRTGQAIVLGSFTGDQLRAEHKAKTDGEQLERAELTALLQQQFAPESAIVDQRKLNALVQGELARLEALPDGISGAIASLRDAAQAAAKTPSARARKDALAAEIKAAISEAKELLSEVELRGAWLFQNVLATKAVEIRLQQAVDRLTTLEDQHHLGIDIGRWLRLPSECSAAAGRRMQMQGVGISAAYLPGTDQSLELPEEFQRPKTFSNQGTDQRTRRPFDPNLPKDHESRLAAGAIPSPRNADGTLLGGSIRHPFAGNSLGVPVPRTDAEDRAAIKKVADKVAAEDGA